MGAGGRPTSPECCRQTSRRFRTEIDRFYRVGKAASKNTYNGVHQVIFLLADAGVTTPSAIDGAVIERVWKILPKTNTAGRNYAIMRAFGRLRERPQAGPSRRSRGGTDGFLRSASFPGRGPYFTSRRTTSDVCRSRSFEEAGGLQKGHRLFAVYATAGLGGLQQGELLHLLKGDVELAGGTVRVRRREKCGWTKLASPIKYSVQARASPWPMVSVGGG